MPPARGYLGGYGVTSHLTPTKIEALHSPPAETCQLKLDKECLCSHSVFLQTYRFLQITTSRIDCISRYSESRELRSHIPFLTGMCKTIYQKQQFLSTAMFLRSYLREIAGL